MKTLRRSDLKIDAKLSPQSAELTLRLREPLGADVRWIGRVRGPFCAERQTLLANYSIRTVKQTGEGVVTIPDFCHWSSAGPFTYQLELELKRGEEGIASLRDSLSIHWANVHQGKFYQAGKRWVPRLARLKVPHRETTPEELANWLASIRTHDLMLVVREGEAFEPLLSACLEQGVAVAMEAAEMSPSKAAEWESLGCVMLLLDPAGKFLGATSLLEAAREDEVPSIGASRWSVRGSEAKILVREAIHEAPEAARAACDLLQAEGARLGDWAGYWA